MKINWLEFENCDTYVKINHVDFNKKINLFVGLTDCGKSQIFEALETMRDIATQAGNLKHVKGKISLAVGEDEYVWEVKTKRGKPEDEVVIAEEKLLWNNNMIFERSDTRRSLNGVDCCCLPLCSGDISYVRLFTEQSRWVKEFYEALLNIPKTDRIDQYPACTQLAERIRKLEKEDSRRWNLTTKDIYRIMMPGVENVYLQPGPKSIHVSLGKYFSGAEDVSAGMLRILGYIVEMQTSKNNLVMIDGFEYGICVDRYKDLWNYIEQKANEGIQFMITSDNPYVIDGANCRSIQIVRRKGDYISITSGRELLLEPSNRDISSRIFEQLIAEQMEQ